MIAGSLAVMGFAHAAEKEWPSQPIRFIVTFAPGGSADTFARHLSKRLSAQLGQSVIVENRQGAGGAIGIDAIAKARPDGHTVGMGATGPISINPNVKGFNVSYSPLKDLAPIAQLTEQPFVLVAHPSVPATNFGEFLKWAKANPDSTYGSVGVATGNHIFGEVISDRFGLQLTHVAYRGAAMSNIDLLAGSIKLAVYAAADAIPLIADKRVNAVLVSTSARSPYFPDTPTLAEVAGGAESFDLWQGMFAPAGTPDRIVKRLNEAFRYALEDPVVTEWMKTAGVVGKTGSPEEFRSFLVKQDAVWGDFVKKQNISVN